MRIRFTLEDIRGCCENIPYFLWMERLIELRGALCKSAEYQTPKTIRVLYNLLLFGSSPYVKIVHIECVFQGNH